MQFLVWGFPSVVRVMLLNKWKKMYFEKVAKLLCGWGGKHVWLVRSQVLSTRHLQQLYTSVEYLLSFSSPFWKEQLGFPQLGWQNTRNLRHQFDQSCQRARNKHFCTGTAGKKKLLFYPLCSRMLHFSAASGVWGLLLFYIFLIIWYHFVNRDMLIFFCK